MILKEDKRSELLNASKHADNYKDQSKGKNRFERRLQIKIASSVREYNSIDMNKFFKDDILLINVPVVGETDNYLVKIKIGGILEIIRKDVERNNGQLDLRIILQAIIKAFNTENVYVRCTCLHPNTKIKLLDGTIPTVAEMAERYDNGEQLYVYSVDDNGDFKPGVVEKVWKTGISTKFIKVTLDNNEEIITTPEHLFMLRDGSYVQAKDLVVNQSLMPLYFNYTNNGYETVKFNSTGKYHSVYKVVADNLKQAEINEAKLRVTTYDNMSYDVAIHHKDFNKNNNNPENLIPMTAKEHWEYHANCRTEISEEGRKRLSEAMKKRNANPTQSMINSRKLWQEKGRLRNYDEDRKQQQSEIFKNIRKNETEKDKKYRYSKYIEGYKKNNVPQKISDSKKIYWESKSKEERSEFRLKVNRQRIGKYIQTILDCGLYPTPELANQYRIKYAPKWDSCFDTWDELVQYFELNHKVSNVEYITVDETDVYDIKVKNYNNFLVNSGVILHNCPDWNYTMSYWSRVNDTSSDRDIEQTNNGKKIRNPFDTKGKGCKHVLRVLSVNKWIRNCASVIFNYINYMKIHYEKMYADIIYPAIYGKAYEDDVQLSIDDSNVLNDTEDEIDISNKEARDRGKFKPGNQSGVQFASDNDEISGQQEFDFDSLD